VNYSWQATPESSSIDSTQLNMPPQNRFNVGMNVSRARYLVNASINFVDSAYWQDVLDARYHGTTDSYVLVNAGVGLRWRGGKLVTSIKATNLLDQEIQQHVFGDVMKRQVVGELRSQF
jgi:hypothetical protein